MDNMNFHCNDFGFTFNIAVSYLGIFIPSHGVIRVIWGDAGQRILIKFESF